MAINLGGPVDLIYMCNSLVAGDLTTRLRKQSMSIRVTSYLWNNLRVPHISNAIRVAIVNRGVKE
jgi:hypothetical protein